MKYTFSVIQVDRLSPSTMLLSLAQHKGERLFTYQPGQYAAISFYKKWRPTPARCFSIVSSPTDQGVLQFSMHPRGRFTKGANNLKPGDKVVVRGPFGGFVLDLAHGGETILIAGGIGVTPFMSMVRYARKVGASNKITLVYSCRSQYDLPFMGDLKILQAQNPNFRVVYVIGDGPATSLAGQAVVSGQITKEVFDPIIANNPTVKTYYICGPPQFMKGIMKTLSSLGVPRNAMLTEAFSQGPNRQTGKIRSWPENMYILGAAGVVLGSFAVMISDLLKTLPPSSVAKTSTTATNDLLTNSRQQDLDQLVNDLPPNTDSAPESDEAKSAQQAVKVPVKSPTPIQTNTATPAPARPSPLPITPAPTPAPKKCVTSQSGVTTCV